MVEFAEVLEGDAEFVTLLDEFHEFVPGLNEKVELVALAPESDPPLEGPLDNSGVP